VRHFEEFFKNANVKKNDYKMWGIFWQHGIKQISSLIDWQSAYIPPGDKTDTESSTTPQK